MNGGSATYGGAFMGGPNQTITVTGNVTMNGGTGTAPGAYDPYGAEIWFNPSVIGWDQGTNVVNLTVGGNLAMTGGAASTYGGSAAMIGGLRVPTAVTINSYGGITMSAAQYSEKIGSLGGYGGSVTMRSGLGGTGSMALGGSAIGTGTTGSVTLVADGTGAAITQNTVGSIMAATLNASTLTSIGSINLPGLNQINNLVASANNAITFNNAASFTASSVTATSTSNGAVTLSSLYGGSISLGSISAGYGATVNASGAIYETNGVGNVDITAGTGGVNLYSQYGGNSGSLAISADISTSGPVNSRAYNIGSNRYVGIRIANYAATAPTNIWMQDDSTYDPNITYYSSSDLPLTAATSFLSTNGGDIFVASGGNLTYNTGNLSTTAAGSIILAATNTLTVSSVLAPANGDLGLVGSTININNTVTAPTALVIAGSTINVNNAVSANGDLGIVGSTVNINNTVDNYGTTLLLSGGTINLLNTQVSANSGDMTIAAGNFTATGSTLFGMNVTGTISGDLRLNNGSNITSVYDVGLKFTGADSKLYLNDAVYANPSYILAGIPWTISLAFTGRSSGGVVIDGVATTTSVAGGSGLFVVNTSTPAVAGAGLDLAYAAVSTTVDICTINPASCAQPTTPTQPPPVVPPVVGPGGTQTPPGSGTTGGGDDQFGGSSSSSGGSSNGKDSDKDKKDDKQSSDSSGDKKDDKSSGKKPVGKCSA
jgi:hypothetical protein